MQRTLDQNWSQQYASGRDYTPISRLAIDKILLYVDRGAPKTCLDIGCGSGQFTRELYHRGYACVGIDASSKAIELAKAATMVKSLSYLHINAEQSNFVSLPLAPYNLITCKLVYAFIKDKPAFLQKVKSVLTTAGVFVVITSLIEDVSPEQHGIAATAEDMQLLAAHFKEVAKYKESGLMYFVGR